MSFIALCLLAAAAFSRALVMKKSPLMNAVEVPDRSLPSFMLADKTCPMALLLVRVVIHWFASDSKGLRSARTLVAAARSSVIFPARMRETVICVPMVGEPCQFSRCVPL